MLTKFEVIKNGLCNIQHIWRGEIMLIKVISLAFDSIYGGFNDQEVRDFLKDKEVISIVL